MQKGKAEPPVYFIYAGPAEFRLAELMGESHQILGIEVPWPLAWRDAVANNQISSFPSMEQLVAPYVAALSSHRRLSSCVLAGHSFAGPAVVAQDDCTTIVPPGCTALVDRMGNLRIAIAEEGA